jgi:hypothetical protein
MVAAAAGLSKGILSSMLHVQSMSSYNFDSTWPTSVSDVTLATILGVLSLLLVIPAAFLYILIMLVREAALIILVATAPISAGGLVSDVGKVWFWKTLRWFFACLLISPAAALLLGLGVRLADGAINHTPPPCEPNNCNADWIFKHLAQMAAWQKANNSASAGMAIVGCIVIAIGAVCPLVLFRLLAFVEPGTPSGAALRQSWSDSGGMSGVLRGGAVLLRGWRRRRRRRMAAQPGIRCVISKSGSSSGLYWLVRHGRQLVRHWHARRDIVRAQGCRHRLGRPRWRGCRLTGLFDDAHRRALRAHQRIPQHRRRKRH